MPLPQPTIELVEKIYEQVYAHRATRDEDDALAKLWAKCPNNTEIGEVLLKVLTLNQLYKTRINDQDIHALACHIVQIRVDDLLAKGDLDTVENIRECAALERKPHSFASKFCSWHNPDVFPIYDSYADTALWGYKKQDGFDSFLHQDLWDYKRYVEVVSKFRIHYGLQSLSLRKIDKFLWTIGDLIKRRELQVEHAG